MGHILIFLHKIVVFKLLAILLSVAMVVVVFEFSSAFKVHALNVHTEIKANPPGIAKIIDRTGNPPPGIVNPTGAQPPLPTSGSGPNTSGTGVPGEPPPDGNGNNGLGGTPGKGNSQSQATSIPPGISNILGGGGGGAPMIAGSSGGSSGPALTINTDIDFGTIFPGETLEEEFTISLTNPGSPILVEYHIEIDAVGGYYDLTPYLTVVRDSNETDSVSDNVTFASLGVGEDVSDRWLVTLAPDPVLGDTPTGDYWTTITLYVDVPEEEPEPPPTEEP